MKTTLAFSLPEERFEFEAALKGPTLYSALYLIDTHLRNRLKYHELTNETRSELEEVRELISQELLSALGDI
jgi:hypothetical protein